MTGIEGLRGFARRMDELSVWTGGAKLLDIAGQIERELRDERATLAADIAMRPYWRWLASMAEEALICGRNHDAIAAAERLLASDPRDLSDVRFTLAYALAKLEDEPAFERLVARYPAFAAPRAADVMFTVSVSPSAKSRMSIIGSVSSSNMRRKRLRGLRAESTFFPNFLAAFSAAAGVSPAAVSVPSLSAVSATLIL